MFSLISIDEETVSDIFHRRDMTPTPSPGGGPEPTDFLGWFIHGLIIFLLSISFLYVLCRRFVSDINLFDLLSLPPSDPDSLTISIDPPCDTVPSIFDLPDVSLTLVAPICPTSFLDDASVYFTSRQRSDASFSWEILVVAGCDCPALDTSARPGVNVIRMPFPVGPGEVVQVGGSLARGSIVAVAYSAVNLDSFESLESILRSSTRRAVVRGSGLLLCSRNVARWIFPNLHIRGRAFITEMRRIVHSRSIAWHDAGDRCDSLVETLDGIWIAALYGMEIWTTRMKERPMSLD
jgi:hypothetical protein